jgi:CHAD domain-containing protein
MVDCGRKRLGSCMTYRFKLREPVSEGVRRVGLAQIEMAEARLRSDDDVATAIHDARRCLKRLRALLRLIRPVLEDAVYEREAKRLAGIGRLLSSERDRHVMQQTLLKLETRFGPLPNGAGKHVRSGLTQVEQGAKAAKRPVRDVRKQALAQLKPAHRVFTGTQLDQIEFAHVEEGVERIYRKARRAYRKAYQRPDDESFHRWRKAVQQHWRHMQLLSRGWPEALSARADEAKALSQILGEDHDLAVLAAFVRKQGVPALKADEMECLEAQCRSCQAELRELAEHRGARLFAEPAENLRERLSAYWASARRLAQSAAEQKHAPNGKGQLPAEPPPVLPSNEAAAPPAGPLSDAASEAADDASVDRATPAAPTKRVPSPKPRTQRVRT